MMEFMGEGRREGEVPVEGGRDPAILTLAAVAVICVILLALDFGMVEFGALFGLLMLAMFALVTD